MGKIKRQVVAGIAATAGIAAGTLATAAMAQSPDTVTLEQLLERAGMYVVDFETRFSNVVTEERYVQESTDAKNNLPRVERPL